MAFFALSAIYMPFKDVHVDWVNFTAQLSTVFTLVLMILFDTGIMQ